MKNDTIAAISTGLSTAGISVIRVSGPDAIGAADRVFRGKKSLSAAKTHTLHHGFIEKDGVPLDEVLAAVMRAPKSYTGEDVVEIQAHGGLFVTEKILEALLESGARPAEPGEFTKRAFLNGRMDLSEAESVMSVISAGNEFALKAGLSGLSGRIAEKIRELRNLLLDEISRIEASLDDPEHYDLTGYGETLSEKLERVLRETETLLFRSEEGAVLSEGVKTVIAGRPNTGKSSLLNLLSGLEKAIVTDIPGTTRDVLESVVRFGRLTLRLMDTAGLRETEDPVEKIGVSRSKAALNDANLIFYLVDAETGKTPEDEAVLSTLPPEKTILLYNKADLLPPDARKTRDFSDGILFSCRTEEGLEALKTCVHDRFRAGMECFDGELVLTEKRQKTLLKDALEAMNAAKEGINTGVSEEFWSADLFSAYTSLGKIIGEEVGDDVVDRVFEKFCMGK